MTALPSAMKELARFFLILSGSSSLGASGDSAGVTASGAVLGDLAGPSSTAPGAAIFCGTAAPPAGAGVLPDVDALPSVSGEHRRRVRSRSRDRRGRSSSDGTDRRAKKRSRRGSPSPERSSHRRERRYRSSSDSSGDVRAAASPPRSRRAHGGARAGESTWDYDRSRSYARVDSSQSGTRHRSPGPSGVAEDDRSSTFESVDFARDVSFRAVLGLLDQNVSGVWSAQEKLLHINLLEMKAMFLALQAFQEVVSGHHVTAMCDNSTVVAYVNKQGGTVSRPLCLLTSRLLRWTESFDVHLEARYLPGESNVLADVLSRRGQVVGTEWSLHPQVARALLRTWGNPSIDLFATCLNAKLPLYCSLVPDPQAVFEDAFRHPWDDLDLYAFPPFALVGRVIARVQQSSRVAMTLVAPLWPEKEWFADLLLLLTQPPLVLPCWDRLLRQPHCNLFHQGAHALNLHAWRLSSDTTESRAFREGLLESCQGSSENLPLACTSRDGRSSVVGVVEGALLQSTPLFL